LEFQAKLVIGTPFKWHFVHVIGHLGSFEGWVAITVMIRIQEVTGIKEHCMSNSMTMVGR
jgi:hypothetical protein